LFFFTIAQQHATHILTAYVTIFATRQTIGASKMATHSGAARSLAEHNYIPESV